MYQKLCVNGKVERGLTFTFTLNTSYIESEKWSSQWSFQFKQLERRSLKKKNQGFNGIRTRDLRVAGALLYQLSYEATHWEQGQFIFLQIDIKTIRKQILGDLDHWNATFI